MARFARMHVERRRSGGGKGRGDLARHVAGLAHTGHDHAAFGDADALDRGREARAQAIAQRRRQRIDAACFRFQRTQGGSDRSLGAFAGLVGGLGHRHGLGTVFRNRAL